MNSNLDSNIFYDYYTDFSTTLMTKFFYQPFDLLLPTAKNEITLIT